MTYSVTMELMIVWIGYDLSAILCILSRMMDYTNYGALFEVADKHKF